MISRVADHCFWFGRYLDRAESSARLLQATRTLVFDADMPVTHCWQPLIIVAGEEEPFCKKYGADALGNGEMVQEYMTWNPENLVSLTSSVRAARHCASRYPRPDLARGLGRGQRAVPVARRVTAPSSSTPRTAKSSIAACGAARS